MGVGAGDCSGGRPLRVGVVSLQREVQPVAGETSHAVCGASQCPTDRSSARTGGTVQGRGSEHLRVGQAAMGDSVLPGRERGGLGVGLLAPRRAGADQPGDEDPPQQLHHDRRRAQQGHPQADRRTQRVGPQNLSRYAGLHEPRHPGRSITTCTFGRASRTSSASTTTPSNATAIPTTPGCTTSSGGNRRPQSIACRTGSTSRRTGARPKGPATPTATHPRRTSDSWSSASWPTGEPAFSGSSTTVTRIPW